MVIRMLTKLESGIEELNGEFPKKESTIKNQVEMKNTNKGNVWV